MADDAWTVESHLRGKPVAVRQLYDQFVGLIAACGPFEYSVSKTAITFKGTRRGFAGAVPKTQWLTGYLDLQRDVSDPRITTSSPYTKRLFVHQFRITQLSELDEEFAVWIGEAYRVGAGDHLLDQ